MKKYRDDVCRLGKCVNLEVCLGLCPALKYVNGKSQSKEVLLSNLINPENQEFRDYKETLSELAEDRETRNQKRLEKLEQILTEPNTRNKLILFAFLAGYSQVDIADYFNLSTVRIFQIIKKAT